MKSIEKKFTTFVLWFVILQPVVDILTSIMVRFGSSSFTVGIIVRALFVVLIAVYLFFFYKGKYKSIFRAFFAGLCLYGGTSIAVSAYYYGVDTVVDNAKMFFKTYYFLFVLIFFFALYLKQRYLVSDWALVSVFTIYTGSVFISAITDTSFATYDYAEGYCGWFYAGNEVGAIVSILAAVALITVVESKNIILKIIVPVLLGFAATYIGTKVPFYACVGAVAVPLLIYCAEAIVKKDKALIIKIASLVGTVVLISALFFFDSPIKKNNDTLMNWHYNNNVTEKLEELNNSKNQASNETSSEKPSSGNPSVSSEEQLDSDKQNMNRVNIGDKMYVMLNWILSNRLDMTKPAFSAYGEATIVQQLFGLGSSFDTPKGVFSKAIEMDFIALVINHGLIGFILYMIPILWFAVVCLKAFFKNIRNFFKMKKEVMYLYSILIALGCAFLAGHVLVAPAVSIYIAIIAVKLYGCLQQTGGED